MSDRHIHIHVCGVFAMPVVDMNDEEVLQAAHDRAKQLTGASLGLPLHLHVMRAEEVVGSYLKFKHILDACAMCREEREFREEEARFSRANDPF